ncbi:UDP-N-acetylmuramate--L-alanine ligase [Candidatus Saganbacteria bacterium]|nr:UDP-N-acetylmuramate--L-alanine ligase [Candidatus Saganbacteria bacterium]
MNSFDIGKHKNIYLIGIGGCGVSAIGKILFQMGFRVSGSDLKESSNTIRLKDLGIKVFIEHSASNLREADLVVYSSAVSKDNVEFMEAKSKNLTIIKRAQMLSWIMDKFKQRVAVAGTHGKTTTTSMISKIFCDARLDPTYLIGGETDYVDGNARLGAGEYAIAEADESDGSFLELNPTVTVLTNIEPDHMEYFGTVENLHDIFGQFIGRTAKDGLLVVGVDNPQSAEIANKTSIRKITYGIISDADITARNFLFDENKSKFNVLRNGKMLGELVLSIPGEQNISNALAAIAVSMEAGIPFSTIASSLHSFTGAKRRFQIIGEVDGILVVDDYAHHPTEIKATLHATKMGWGDDHRIIAIFQPHRYSRTLNLFSQFGEAFIDADLVILTDIYSAGESPIQNVDGRMISREVEKHQDVLYVQRKERIPEILVKMLKPNDLILTMGAGDINNIGKEILSRLKIKL